MKKLIVTLLFIFSLTFGDNFQPLCEFTQFLDKSTIYHEQDEIRHVPLHWYFQGLNLNFNIEVENSQSQTIDNPASISQRVEIQDTQDFYNDLIIGTTNNFDSSGTGEFCVLTKNESEFFIHYGNSAKNKAPVFTKNIMLYTDQYTNCFDVAQINDDIVIVDCRQKYRGQQIPFKNIYYILNSSDIMSAPYQILNTYYGIGDIMDRYIHVYTASNGDKYVLSGLVFDHLKSDLGRNNCYLSFYRYITYPPNEEYPNGYLTPNPPITAHDFNLTELYIAGFSILNSRIYVVDHTQGLFSFNYIGNTMTDVTFINLDNLGISNVWGLSVSYDNGYIQIIVADEDYLYQLHLDDYDSIPQLTGQYTLGIKVASTIEIQSNANYITVQIGQIIHLYKRYQSNLDQLYYVFQDFHLAHLFYSSHLLVFTEDQVTNYVIQEPSLDIWIDSPQNEYEVLITATSSYLTESPVSCSLNININSIKPASTGIFDTGISPQIQYVTKLNGPSRAIMLDETYIGPNLNFSIIQQSIKQNTNSFLAIQQEQKQYSEGDETSIILDIPNVIQKVNIPEADPTNWIFSRQIAVSSELFFTLHQSSKDFSVYIYKCNIYENDLSQINCTVFSNITNLTSKIMYMSYGLWYQFIPVIGLVTEDNQKTFQLYYMNGQLVHSHQLECNVMSITIFQQQLFVIASNDSLLIYRHLQDFMLVDIIDEYYISSWDIVKDDWTPKYVLTNINYKNTIFLISLYHIYIIEISDEPHYLSQITINTKESYIQCTVYLADNSLLVFYENSIINEYNLQNLEAENINTKMATYHTYDRYQFITSNISIPSLSQNGLFYVLANDIQANQGQGGIVVLVYRTFSPMLKTLYSSIPLGEKSIDKTKQFVVHSSHWAYYWMSEMDIVLVILNGKIFYLRVPVIPSVVITPSMPINTYTEFYYVNVNINSNLNNTSQQIQQSRTISVVNNQKIVSLNLDEIIKSGLDNIQVNEELNNKKQIFQFNVSNWVNGPVLGYYIECKNCSNGIISLKNRVLLTILQQFNQFERIQTGDEFFPQLSDGFFSHITGKIYFLEFNQVTIYDSPGFQKVGDSILIDQSKGRMTCSRLVPGQSNVQSNIVLQYIFAFCFNYNLNTVMVAPIEQLNIKNHNSLQQNTALAPISIDINKELGEIQIKDGFLLIQNIQSDEVGTSVVIYSLYDDIKQKRPIATRLIELGKDQPVPELYLQVQSFQVVDSSNSDEKILFIQNKTSHVIYFTLNTQDYLVHKDKDGKLVWQYVNLQQEIKSHRGYIEDLTTFVTFKIINSEIKIEGNQNFMTYRAILSTSNTAIYDLIFVFLSNGDESPLLKNFDIICAYQNYGDAQILKRIEYSQPYIAVAYFNKNNLRVSNVIYSTEQIQLEQLNPQILTRDLKMRQIIGGYDYQYPSQGNPDPSFFFLYDEQGNPELFSTDPSGGNSRHFSLDSQNIQISVSSNKFDKQVIKFTPISDFIFHGIQFNASIESVYKPASPPSPVKGADNWIIIVIILSGVIILGLVGYFVYQKKDRKRRELLESTKGMSLQEPLKA